MTTSSNPASANATKGGAVLAILAAAMFVYVIDTTLMNVSISALVEDPGKGESEAVAETVRNSTIPGVQLEMDDLPNPT